MSFYRRNLPHWQPEMAEYFVTFRLNNSLPHQALEKLAAQRRMLEQSDKSETEKQRRIFNKYEKLLDHPGSGPTWLAKEAVGQIVCEAMHYRDKNQYDLYAYCVMPNHVHLVFKLMRTKTEYPITKLLQELKRFTARECNKILDRTGQFWQHESFDRVIRDKDELENTIRYVLNNPVKAKLVKQWQDWDFSYCKPAFIETFNNM